MARLRLLCPLLLWHIVQGTTISNPCTSDAIKQQQFYHPYPLDSGSYVQCDDWGTPIIRRCPALQVWSAEYVTCVYPAWSNSGSVSQKVLTSYSQPGKYNNYNTTDSSQDTHQYGSNPSVDLRQGQLYSINSEFSWQAYFAAPGAPVDPSKGLENQQLQSISNSMPKQNTLGSGLDSNAGKGNDALRRHDLTFASPASNAPVNVTAEAGSASASQPNPADGRYINEASGPAQVVNSSQFGSYRSNWMSRWLENSQMDPAMGSQTSVGRDMNPCNRPNVRYIAHESNPNLYYECVGMMPMERMCAREKVWAQEHNQCVISTYNISSSPCSAQTSPSQIVGTPVTLPYPGDPSKYIVCYDSNRFEMRSCPAGQRWADQSKQCVALDSSLPAVSPGGGHDQIRPDICAVSRSASAASFYHSYPPDASRFLQCDELGNVYLRYCGTNKIWKDDLKTCVGGAAELSLFSSSLTSPGQPLNNSTGVSAVNGSMSNSFPPVWAAGKESTLATSKLTGPSTLGPYGTSLGVNSSHLSGTTDQIDGSNTQTIIVAEIFRIVCPRGYRYVIERGVCSVNQTDPSIGPIGSPNNSGVKCPPNFDWNVQLNLCARRFSTGRSNGGGDNTSITYSGNSTSTTVAQSGTGNTTHDNETTQYAAQRLPSLPVEANPCDRNNIGVLSGFYFPFPDNAAFFVQCDATGVAFVQACPSGLVWNKSLVTCVRKQASLEPNGRAAFYNTPAPYDSVATTDAANYKPETNVSSIAKSYAKY